MTDRPVLMQEVRLPAEPIDHVVGPIARFLHVESASGVVLLLATVAALVLANSPASEDFLSLWQTPLGFSVGAFEMHHSLKHWINDGLMAIFFFVVSLEVKRELIFGELRELRVAALPIAAALGGTGGASGPVSGFSVGRGRPTWLGHSDGDRHRLRGWLHGPIGAPCSRQPANSAAVSRHRR